MKELCLMLGFCELNCAFLSWFRGPCVHHSLTLTVFLPPLLPDFLSSDVWVWTPLIWWTPPIWTLSPQTVWLWVSTSVSISCSVKPLWWWLDKALIYEYCRIALEIFFLLFFRPVMFVVTLVLWAIESLVFGYPYCTRYGYPLMELVNVKSDFGLLLLKIPCHYYSSIFCRKIIIFPQSSGNQAEKEAKRLDCKSQRS